MENFALSSSCRNLHHKEPRVGYVGWFRYTYVFSTFRRVYPNGVHLSDGPEVRTSGPYCSGKKNHFPCLLRPNAVYDPRVYCYLYPNDICSLHASLRC